MPSPSPCRLPTLDIRLMPSRSAFPTAQAWLAAWAQASLTADRRDCERDLELVASNRRGDLGA